jgi:AcrR family transcriptional regulator
MSYRHLDNIDEKIINATIQIGSSNEANKLSTKKIAKACEISEFVIYDHFKSKDNLISITNHKIFEDSAAYVEQLILVEHQPFEVYWNKMVDFFLQNQNYVGWSINYGHIFPRPEKPADNDEFREDITAEARKCFSYLNLKNDWNTISSICGCLEALSSSPIRFKWRASRYSRNTFGILPLLPCRNSKFRKN